MSGVVATRDHGLRVRDRVRCDTARGRQEGREDVGWGGENLGLHYIHFF